MKPRASFSTSLGFGFLSVYWNNDAVRFKYVHVNLARSLDLRLKDRTPTQSGGRMRNAPAGNLTRASILIVIGIVLGNKSMTESQDVEME